MLWTLILSCSFEDGSREHGDSCGRDEHCADGLQCSLWSCLLPEGSVRDGRYCVADSECMDEDSFCDPDIDECRREPDNEGGITCNDGTRSPTCSTCSSGCCSGHGGCL